MDMIKDYSVYEMSDKQRWIFYLAGYTGIFIATYLFYHSILLSAVLGSSVCFFLPFVKKHLADKRMQALNLQFKDLLDSLSASIASGRQMEEALLEAGEHLSLIYEDKEPIMKELRYMRINILENKESDKPLLTDFAFRSKNEDINNFVQVYVTCRNMGGNLEKIILNSSEVIVDKMNIQREIKAITAQKKTEGRLISLMPLLMLLMMNLFSYSYIAPLYETVGGRIIMTAALGAMVYGMYLMEKLSDIEL
ncbi:MAG: type II secretion system F family protein [Bacillota bacterium]|nr:type II secretion system F family protein [Bacillota bacterium]